MSYLYTKATITPTKKRKDYTFEILATSSLNLDRAIEDAKVTIGIWGGMAPEDTPKVQWSGEQEISNNKTKQFIMDTKNHEEYEQVLSDLNHKGWAYISMP